MWARMLISLGVLVAPVVAPASAPAAADGRAEAALVRQTCEVFLMNDIPRRVPLESLDAHSHDNWQRWPQNPIRPPEAFGGLNPVGSGVVNNWVTRSGSSRGCWNIVQHRDGDGAIEVRVNNPYRGAHRATCEGTGRYRCQGPLPRGWGEPWFSGAHPPYDGSVFRAGTLRAVFYACDIRRQATRRPSGIRRCGE